MKTKYKVTFSIVLVLALAGILIGIYMFNLKHKDLLKSKPDFVISASDLQKAFESDEKTSTLKFVNKVIEVTGIIESVKTGEDNSLNVSLKTGSGLSSIICTFQKNPDLSPAYAGKQVTIRGECSGFLMDVLMNNCVIAGIPK